MNYWLQFFLVFTITAIADVCWTMYFMSVADKKAFKAAIWGAAILICGGFSIISYTEDKSFLIAAILGGFVGTYLTVKYKK